MSRLKPIETKTLSLSPGLHILTYAEATDSFNPPLVNIAIPIGLIGSRVSLMFLEPLNEGFLTKPDEAVVIYIAGESAELLIGIFIGTQCNNPEIKLKTRHLIENHQATLPSTLSQHDIPVTNNKPLSTDNILPLAFSGHVEWQGDQQLNLGQGLGNPDKNWRIERFAIHWPNKPNGVEIEYGCYVKTLGETPKTTQNNFVGTKARALPITALSAQLIGVNADNYQLTLDVIFSETGLRPINANGQLIWGIHENEFLTGLRGFVTQKTTTSDATQASSIENRWSNTASVQPLPIENTVTVSANESTQINSIDQEEDRVPVVSATQADKPSNVISFS
jgi:hypothetical protein